MPDEQPIDNQSENGDWEKEQYAAGIARSEQPDARASNPQAENQAAATAQLQAAQTAAYQNQMIQLNAAQAVNAAQNADAEAQIIPLRQKAQKLARQSSSWKRYYILLLFGALLVDGLSIIFIILGMLIPPIVIVSDVISMIYSAIRFMALREINKGAPKNEEWLSNVRTFASGAFKLLPVVGAVPLQTVTMISEWQIKKASTTQTDSQLHSVREAIEKIAA